MVWHGGTTVWAAPRALVRLMAVAVLTAAASVAAAPASWSGGLVDAAGAPVQIAAGNSDEFRIVDCLLPGQLRKLGRMATYVTPRRPVKTSVGDCELRGGEYVAEDRGSYAYALKIWLPLAKEGDPKAQTFVGEIFEKGLGLEPNYQTAAAWYKRAAEQGYSPAQINLGNLYEKGLGVPRDPKRALEWYRRASGLGDAGLEFVSAGELQDLRSEVTQRRAESQELRAEIDRLQGELDRSRRQLEKRRSEAARQNRQIDQASSALAAERARYAAERRALEQQRQRVAEVRAQYQSKLDEIAAAAPRDDRERLAALAELKRQQAQATALREELSRLREALAERETKTVDRTALEAERARFTRMEADYKRQLADLEAARRRSEERLSEKDRAESAALREQLDRLRAELEGREDRIAKQNAALAAREREIAGKEAKLAELDKELAKLKQQAEKRRAELGRLTEKGAVRASSDGPVIELIDPKVQLATRGVPVVQLRGVTKSRVIVGRVKSAAGLMALVVNDREQSLGEDGLFRSTVPVMPSGTRVSIVAIDKRGKKTDLEFMLQPPGAGNAAGAAVASAIGTTLKLPSIDFGTYHALVIGNNDYRYLPDLDTAVNDAKSVGEVLKKRYDFKVKLLLNATRYDILSALNDYRKNLTEKDNLLIYYAGHGELDKANQRGHWLPVDAEPESTANWISNIAITDMLNATTAKHIIVVADSCYSGALTRSALARLEAGMSKEARATWVATILKKRARLALTSGGMQPVLDAGGGDHSIFAKAFLDVLKQNKGVMEARRVHQQVATRVTYAADAFRYDQLPEYAPISHARHGGGEFFFVARGT